MSKITQNSNFNLQLVHKQNKNAKKKKKKKKKKKLHQKKIPIKIVGALQRKNPLRTL